MKEKVAFFERKNVSLNIPGSLRVKSKGHFTKAKCEKCGRKINVSNLARIKGRMLCKDCRLNKNLSFSPYSLEEALSRTYNISGHIIKKRYLVANLSLPQVLAGHKVKIILAGENKSKTKRSKNV